MQHDAIHAEAAQLGDGIVPFKIATKGIYLFEQPGFKARLSIRSDGSTELTLNGDSLLVAPSPLAAKRQAETLYAAHIAGDEDTASAASEISGAILYA